MDKRLQDFFFSEQEQGRLNFDADLKYADLLRQSLSLFPDGDLPNPVFDLMELTNSLSFAHGLKLGLRLREWTHS